MGQKPLPGQTKKFFIVADREGLHIHRDTLVKNAFSYFPTPKSSKSLAH